MIHSRQQLEAIRDGLSQALAYLSDRHRWCQGAASETRGNSAHGFQIIAMCAQAAIHQACHRTVTGDAERIFMQANPQVGGSIPQWNDDKMRAHGEVLIAFRAAIAFCDARLRDGVPSRVTMQSLALQEFRAWAEQRPVEPVSIHDEMAVPIGAGKTEHYESLQQASELLARINLQPMPIVTVKPVKKSPEVSKFIKELEYM